MSDSYDVNVALGPRSYHISVVSDQFDQFAETLETWMNNNPAFRNSVKEGNKTAFIVTDRNLSTLHTPKIENSLKTKGWKWETAVIESGEKSKSLAVISSLYDRLVELKADRQTVLIAVGGGVTGDAAGFVAATYVRGLPFVQVPTSLLAHVDSSVGGKVGVNHPQAKNLIGAFYQPLGVFIDTSTLETLPERDYRSGLAEIVKYGVILDSKFFQYLEQNIEALNQRSPDALRTVIARSCELKAEVVEQDEYERTGLRAILNYGHTFAHAFEALCGYGELMHGEAVSIGMVYASYLAEKLNLIPHSDTKRQIELLQALGLPVSLPEGTCLETDEIIDRMKLDKKTVGGKLRFVLPTCIGRVEVFKDISESLVREVLEELAQTKARNDDFQI
ncbi:3-dehydroquinate synthase [Gimesia fumaroli]|uniref:3-dehydroquinate synthase n=1 Tax=Gimesia fumaroli TaxID=2527976 RepID=A0A518II92_9PLAN|nr:3-dehydroquinate synthase [Gimesia fumaroli]QDV52808.1 3-dehydroquinate synthase [Gimesia fumaroli]